MKRDLNVTQGSGNIFADLRLPNAEEHLLKAQIVTMIAATVKSRGLPQVAVARIIGVTQPDVSKILRGNFEGFSLERLLSFLMALGHNVKMCIEPANENYAPGHLRVAL